MIFSVSAAPDIFAACNLRSVPGLGSMAMMLFLSDMSIAVLLTVKPVPPITMVMMVMMVPASTAFVSPEFLLPKLSQPISNFLRPLSGQILLHRIILVIIHVRRAQLFLHWDWRLAISCASHVSAQYSLLSSPRLSMV